MSTSLKPAGSLKQFSEDSETELPTKNCDKEISNSSNSKHKDPSFLSELVIRNTNRPIIGNLSINSISNKFDNLKAIIEGTVDILVVTETKLDSTFPTNQFYINGFTKPYGLDRNRNGTGVLIYICKDVPNKELKSHLPNDIEGMFIELNLIKKTNCLLFQLIIHQSDDYLFHNFKNNLDRLNYNVTHVRHVTKVSKILLVI